MHTHRKKCLHTHTHTSTAVLPEVITTGCREREREVNSNQFLTTVLLSGWSQWGSTCGWAEWKWFQNLEQIVKMMQSNWMGGSNLSMKKKKNGMICLYFKSFTIRNNGQERAQVSLWSFLSIVKVVCVCVWFFQQAGTKLCIHSLLHFVICMCVCVLLMATFHWVTWLSKFEDIDFSTSFFMINWLQRNELISPTFKQLHVFPYTCKWIDNFWKQSQTCPPLLSPFLQRTWSCSWASSSSSSSFAA